MALRQPRAHVGEHRGRAGERLRDGRDQSGECVGLNFAEAPFVGIGLRQPLPGGATLAARRVPCLPLGDRQRIEDGNEFAIGADVRVDRREDRVGRRG